jgi:ABC-type proline/glycine betaine transport system substrate-binding protein
MMRISESDASPEGAVVQWVKTISSQKKKKKKKKKNETRMETNRLGLID